jgi:hypothetical protein
MQTLLMIGLFVRSFAIFNVKNMKLNSLIKNFNKNFIKESNNIYYDDYYVDWTCGEVQWDWVFEDKTFEESKCIDSTPINYSSKTQITNKNNIDILAINSGILNMLYDEVVKLDEIVLEIQEFDFSNYISEQSFINLFTLLLTGGIGYSYENIKIDRKKMRKKTFMTLKEIEQYIKIKKMTKIFALSLLMIFVKNVKPAE